MTCDICHLPLLSHQSRHYNGEGYFHMVCEFNIIRKRLGLPLFQDVLRTNYYYNKTRTVPTTPSSPSISTHKTKKDSWDLFDIM